MEWILASAFAMEAERAVGNLVEAFGCPCGAEDGDGYESREHAECVHNGIPSVLMGYNYIKYITILMSCQAIPMNS